MEQVLERRSTSRKHPLFYLPLHDIKQERLLGHVFDITPHGCMIMRSRPLKVSDYEYELRLMVPGSLGHERSGIYFMGQCMWCKKDANPDLYTAGLRISELDAEAHGIIDAIIRHYCFIE